MVRVIDLGLFATSRVNSDAEQGRAKLGSRRRKRRHKKEAEKKKKKRWRPKQVVRRCQSKWEG